MRTPAAITRVADSLRAVHAGPAIPSRFDAFRVVEAYRATAATHGISTPPAYDEAKQIADRVERARGVTPERPCHNDLLNANFIDDGHLIRIVDWEYAGMGDVFFDLANFAISHEFSSAQMTLLLEAYFGDVRPEHERALQLMRFMSDLREATWGVVQQAVSELDFDFAGYAADHFERLAATAAEPAFQEALEG